MPKLNPYKQRRLERQRKRRIERLLQKFDLLDHRETVYHIWGRNPGMRTLALLLTHD
jgi:hypothetical protein